MFVFVQVEDDHAPTPAFAQMDYGWAWRGGMAPFKVGKIGIIMPQLPKESKLDRDRDGAIRWQSLLGGGGAKT